MLGTDETGVVVPPPLSLLLPAEEDEEEGEQPVSRDPTIENEIADRRANRRVIALLDLCKKSRRCRYLEDLLQNGAGCAKKINDTKAGDVVTIAD